MEDKKRKEVFVEKRWKRFYYNRQTEGFKRY